MHDIVIAIDGPAGAGKSTVAGLVAKELGIKILDTGAMYRAFALLALEQGLDQGQAEELVELAERVEVTFGPEGGSVLANGREVGDMIRTLEVGQAASQFSTVSGVRRRMVALQQAIVERGSWILEGRDVTTVVAPRADIKVFLTASIEERARRRWMETLEPRPRLQELVKDVVERDHRDYTRSDSPLCLAEDAVIIESFGLTPEQVAQKIIDLTAAF